MAKKHLKEEREYTNSGLDLDIFKDKIFNWLAIEIDESVPVKDFKEKPFNEKGDTIEKKIKEKADKLAEIIHEYITNAFVYVDLLSGDKNQTIQNNQLEFFDLPPYRLYVTFDSKGEKGTISVKKIKGNENESSNINKLKLR